MMDPVKELKTRAEILHHAVHAREPKALSRLRRLPELRARAHEQLTAVLPTIRRKHCLAIVAGELGFGSWEQARLVLSGVPREQDDFGKLLYDKDCSHYLNQWFASYREAAAYRTQHGGTLLAYARQFVVVDHPYIECLGLDPADLDWERIGHDWVRPRSLDARRRLYAKRLAAMRGAP